MRVPAFVVVSCLFAGCQTPLPTATPAAGHGLERVWIESLGLE
ncbi:MAG TPA: hypothetical protein VFZ65_04960 [Planctomycetota bacterium]|nr:hypothetical protein [Planctomycetota bacterium]